MLSIFRRESRKNERICQWKIDNPEPIVPITVSKPLLKKRQLHVHIRGWRSTGLSY